MSRYCPAESWQCRDCINTRPDYEVNYWRCAVGVETPAGHCPEKVSKGDLVLSQYPEERRES